MKELAVGYFAKERKYIGTYLGCVGIFCAVLFLYNESLEGICYAAVLSSALLAGVLAMDFVRYVRRYGQLTQALAALPYELGEFPDTTAGMETMYQKKLTDLYLYCEELESKMRIGRQDMLDYYSLWAHQIKTPIAAMRLLIQTREGMEWKEKQEEEFLKNLKIELFKTEQYVEMVLSYLRMEEMSSDLILQWYSLDEMICQAVKKYSTLFIMKKIPLEYSGCKEMVLTDEKWLVFVIEQLLSNALKYTIEGKISIYQEEGEFGRLVIEDTGIGIQQEDLPRIFEKGFTGYNGRQDKKSTGIGLYLCKTICDKLNHGIEVESEVGRGTRMYLSLKRQNLNVE